MTNRRPPGYWPENVREALWALGGEADLRDIYCWIKDNKTLTNNELSLSSDGYHARVDDTVRGAINTMHKKDELIKVTRQRYRINHNRG